MASKGSVLLNKLGEQVASELVTIIDSGNPGEIVNFEGSFYYVPFDDEGSIKKHTTVVENGVLKSYLTSLDTAPELGVELSGNGRAQDHTHAPIVRQTNYFILPRDRNPTEMFEGIREGYYVLGRGAGGGQVDTAMGTFTFQAGPSYYIENGQIKHMVYNVMLSGQILEALKSVDAVGNDLRLTTSARGGCGKGGQLVKVGHGGPHVRLKLTIGGR
jgi:TldD protein